MRWIIDADILIEAERGKFNFAAWLDQIDECATADVVRGEFLIGIHLVEDAGLRQRGETFYQQKVSGLISLENEKSDFETAARLVGEARRANRGKPFLIDGLIAAIALRTGSTVATRNLKDFEGMGCPCSNPLEHPSA